MLDHPIRQSLRSIERPLHRLELKLEGERVEEYLNGICRMKPHCMLYHRGLLPKSANFEYGSENMNFASHCILHSGTA